MRIFSISDLHLDYSENLQWTKDISAFDHKEDILILAGDISDKLSLLETTLFQLSSKFNKVAFVPGNHDLWMNGDIFTDSFAKFNTVISLAKSLNIKTQPFTANGINFHPIYSWYDFSFGHPSEDLFNQWNDFHRCTWPEILDQTQIANLFFAQNKTASSNTNPTISYSHFVPRMDLFPKGPPKIISKLMPCFGSTRIESHIRAVNSDIHLYGHSHLNWDVTIDGVRYINNAFGYPKEKHISRKKLLEINI